MIQRNFLLLIHSNCIFYDDLWQFFFIHLIKFLILMNLVQSSSFFGFIKDFILFSTIFHHNFLLVRFLFTYFNQYISSICFFFILISFLYSLFSSILTFQKISIILFIILHYYIKNVNSIIFINNHFHFHLLLIRDLGFKILDNFSIYDDLVILRSTFINLIITNFSMRKRW